MMSAAESEPRRLGPAETFYHLLIDKYNACYYVHIAVIRSSQRLSFADVKKAFEVLCRQHDALRMRIVPIEGEELAYRFEPMREPVVDLSLVKMSKKSDWPELLSEVNQPRMDCFNGPLWKVTMANIEDNTETNINNKSMQHQCLILMKIHHALADAKSMSDFIYLQLMTVLLAIVNKEPSQGLISKVPLYKSTEELFGSKFFDDSRPKVSWFLKVLLDIVRWKNRTFGTSFQYENHFFFPDEHKLSKKELSQLAPCHSKLLDKELSSSIIKSAKANGVTVHCVFLAVNSIALCKTAKEAGIQLPRLLQQNSPIDLRKYLNWKRPHPLGLHISLFDTTTKNQIEYSVCEFWKMCKDIRSDSLQKTTRAKSTATLGTQQYFMDVAVNADFIETLTEIGMAAISVVSNTGVCDIGAQPALSKGGVNVDLAEQYFTVTGWTQMNSVPFVHDILTYRGQIAWTFTYNVANVGRRFADKYLKNIEDTFQRYCAESEV